MWLVAATVARAVWKSGFLQREVFNKSWWHLILGFISPVSWRSRPGSRKSCVRVDFYTDSLPSALSREESKRKEESRPPAAFAFLQTRLCRAPGHPEGDEDSNRREMCGRLVCDSLAPPPSCQGLGFVHARRRECCVDSSVSSFHSL